MMKSSSLLAVAGSLLLSACPYRSTPLLGTEDGGPSSDASSDASVVDSRPGSDTGVDAPPGTDAGPDFEGREFYEALSCGFDRATALRAVVREVACTHDSIASLTTIRGITEAWEVGLFSGLESNVFGPIGHGCAEWQCVAAATSCAEREACRDAGESCESGSRCNGTSVEYCRYHEDPSLRRWRGTFDCGGVGGTCETLDGVSQCLLGDCRFVGGGYVLECDGDDLTLCDGAARVSCGDVAPGAVCASLAVSGEAPTRFCNPSGVRSTAGVYDYPNDCTDGVVAFTSASEVEYRFDCVAAGYSGCDDSGCVL